MVRDYGIKSVQVIALKLARRSRNSICGVEDPAMFRIYLQLDRIHEAIREFDLLPCEVAVIDILRGCGRISRLRLAVKG
jgi:hypothetical protein